MSHTPGPWGYDCDSKEIFSSTEEHGCGWIATVGGNDSEDRPLPAEMQAANARLIASAPELLSALKDLMALYKQGQLVIEGEADEGDEPVVGAAMSAIAKAEGRGE